MTNRPDLIAQLEKLTPTEGECEYEKCTRVATVKNNQYFPNKWLCTYHANKLTKEGRQHRKYGKRKIN